MDAIVYTSNTGYTEQYARMLGKETGLPVWSLKDSRKELTEGAEIIYLGWIMANTVKGYKKACRLFNIRAVCAVGISPDGVQTEAIKKQSGIADIPVFVMQGGFDINKLSLVYKLMMKMMIKTVSAKFAKKDKLTEQESDVLDLMVNGGSRVSRERLAPVLNWIMETKNQSAGI